MLHLRKQDRFALRHVQQAFGVIGRYKVAALGVGGQVLAGGCAAHVGVVGKSRIHAAVAASLRYAGHKIAHAAELGRRCPYAVHAGLHGAQVAALTFGFLFQRRAQNALTRAQGFQLLSGLAQLLHAAGIIGCQRDTLIARRLHLCHNIF